MNFKVSRLDNSFYPAVVDVLDLFEVCEEMSEGKRYPLAIVATKKPPSEPGKRGKSKR